MCMGHIYQIRNTVNDAVYIGSVLKRNPQDRWGRHKKDLRGGRHHSLHLQRAWNKYGESKFVFELLEYINLETDVLSREQSYMDVRKTQFSSRLNYNVYWTAGSPMGRKWSLAMRAKLSKAHLGMKPTKEAIEKQKATWSSKCKRPYNFTSPEGVHFKNIKNLRQFARDNKLNHGCLRLLDKGDIHHHKGWTKFGTSPSWYELFSPEGYYAQGMVLKELCRKFGANYKMIHSYCIKRGKKYQGWWAVKKS